MDLSSSLSGPKEFRLIKRGYDPDEVDAFLDQVALGVAELKRRLAESEERIEALATSPGPQAAGPKGEEIQRALILAGRAADEELRQARQDAERITADARTQSERMIGDAEGEVARRRDEGRTGLLEELRELGVARDELSNDIVVLERHVEEQREGLQAAIGELQALLDHPEAFRVAPPGELSDVRLPTDEPTSPSPVLAPSDDPIVIPDPDPDRNPGSAASADPSNSDATPSVPGPPATYQPPASTTPPMDDRAREEAERAGQATGPATQAVEVGGEPGALDDDDAFLAELRKAMTDDEPLGPGPEGPSGDDQVEHSRRGFGRRR